MLELLFHPVFAIFGVLLFAGLALLSIIKRKSLNVKKLEQAFISLAPTWYGWRYRIWNATIV
jgi:hypothetical protein